MLFNEMQMFFSLSPFDFKWNKVGLIPVPYLFYSRSRERLLTTLEAVNLPRTTMGYLTKDHS